MKFSLALLTVLVAPLLAVAGSSQPSRMARDEPSLNPPVTNDIAALASNNQPRMSNAERLRRGLNLNPPATPTTHAKRHGASLTPRSGNLQIKDEGGNVIGWVSRDLNEHGEYCPTTNKDKALQCSYTENADGSPSDITVSNSMFSDLPFFGAFVGWGSKGTNLVSGSFNYLFITATSQVSQGSLASIVASAFEKATSTAAQVQTSIWKWDSVSSIFKAVWVNAAGSTVEGTLCYVKSKNALAIVGDYEAFVKQFKEDVVKCTISLA